MSTVFYTPLYFSMRQYRLSTRAILEEDYVPATVPAAPKPASNISSSLMSTTSLLTIMLLSSSLASISQEYSSPALDWRSL
jgi:hypothetical protein